MYQHEGMHRRASTPRSPKPPTVEQLLQGDGSNWSAGPCTPTLLRDHDSEEDHGHYHKKSVLAKVKEKAQRWRRSLSKRKSGDDGNITPSWGVSLDEDENENIEDDPEYLGAPMYESELAPEDLKETARQHPRAVPVISPKHTLTCRPGDKEDQWNSISHDKTITETVTEKLPPAYATVSDATHAIASKIQNLTIGSPHSVTGPHPHQQPSRPSPLNKSLKTTILGSDELTASASDNREFIAVRHERVNPREQLWDKGVSVKEYLIHKFEPGDDERALSRVISETLSPRRSPGDPGVVAKVKEAVSSLLHHDESSSSSQMHSAKSSLSDIPISKSAHTVAEEETHGRILQAN